MSMKQGKLMALVLSAALAIAFGFSAVTSQAAPLPGPDGAVAELHLSGGGTRWYASVEEALNSARTGEKVTLLQDVDLTGPVSVTETGSSNFEFDLNGHYIRAEQSIPYALILGSSDVNAATMTVIDSQNSENGRIWAEGRTTSNTAVKVEKGTLILRDGGMIEANDIGVELAGGNFTLKNGGAIDALNGPAIDVDNSSSNVSIEDGYITTHEGTDQSGDAEFRYAIEVTAVDTISVTGGNITGEIVGEGATGFLKGGSFRPCPEDTYIADGYIAIHDEGFGRYNIVKNENRVVFDPETAVYDPFNHKQRHTAVKLISPTGSEIIPASIKWYKYNKENNNWVDINQNVANPYLDDALPYKAVLTYDNKEHEAEFIVQPYDISECRNQTQNKTFTGFDFDVTKDIEVSKPGEGVLKNFTAEVKSVSGNRNVGTCEFTIEGTDNYKGELSSSFSINPADFANVKFSLSYDKITWTGKAFEPGVTGTLTTGEGEGAKVYTLDPSEYEVEYSDNVDPGTAAVTITRASDNYSGDTPQTLNFEIEKAVAKVTDGENESFFTTAKGAFDAAEDGDSVVLISDTAEEASISVNKNITIDLGEYALGSAEKRFDIEIAEGTSAELKGTGKLYGRVTNYGTLDIKGGEIMYGEGDDEIYGLENRGEASMSAGIIRGGIINYEGEMPITGGTVLGELWSVTPATFAISGGYFDKPVNQNHCADHYHPADAPEGSPAKYTVELYYKVTFDLNGHGSEAMRPDRQEVITDGKAEKPDAIVDEDNYLGVDKWYEDPDCAEEWDFDTDIVSKHMTLYAKWQHYHDGHFFEDWTSADSMPDAPGNYILNSNVTLTDSWSVPEGEFNICLNGKTIRVSENANAPVIRLNGENRTVRIYDDTGEGKITGAQNYNDNSDEQLNVHTGGGVYVYDNSVFELYGGNITGNKAYYGGGVAVRGTFNMYGGTISNNYCYKPDHVHNHDDGKGAGVYVLSPNRATFNMYGGEIKNNTATEDGGGVYAGSNGIFTMFDGKITGNIVDIYNTGGVAANEESRGFHMYGGEITGNKSGNEDYGAGGVHATRLYIGGDAGEMKKITITGNTDKDGNADDLIVTQDSKVIVLSEMTEDSKIGLNQFHTWANEYVVTEGLEGNGSIENFINNREYDPDDYQYKLVEDDGEAVFKRAYQLIFDPEEGSGVFEPAVVLFDEVYELPVNPFTEPVGKLFIGWKIGVSDEINEPGYKYTPTSNTTITAQYDYILAEVEETGEKFSSLVDARKAMESGQTIKLLRDTNLGNKYFDTLDKALTLDLNGHEIICDAQSTVIAHSDLTIKDTSEGKEGVIVNTSSNADAAAVRANANVTLENGTLEGENYGITLMDTGKNVSINGGTVTGGKKSVNNATDSATFKINGGRFSDDEGNGDLYERPAFKSLYKDGEDGYYKLADYPVTVSFAKGGEEGAEIKGEMDPETAGANLSYKLPECAYTRAGYVFDGWDARGKKYNAGDLISLEGNTTFTATWVIDHKCEENWDDGEVITEPTIGAEGVMKYTCTKCGKTKEEPIQKVDAKPLTDAIKAARDAESGVATSNDGSDVAPSDKWTTADEKEALDKAIADAQKVADNKASTQSQVDDAVEAVKDAQDTYDKAKKAGTKEDKVDPSGDEEAEKKAAEEEAKRKAAEEEAKKKAAEEEAKKKAAEEAAKKKAAEEAAKKKAAEEAKANNVNEKAGIQQGANLKAVDNFLAKRSSDGDPKGSKVAPLKLKSAKQTSKAIGLSFSKVKGAKKYVIYGNLCSKKNKMQKLATTTKAKFNVKKIKSAKLKKGKYYKFLVIAIDANDKVVATSKYIHVATKGGKVGNHKSVKTAAKNNKVTLKTGKSFKLQGKAIPKSKKLKVKKHRVVIYESSNAKVAAVSKKGLIKGRAKGTCEVYAYAQNGVMKTIKVTVK